MITEDSPTAPGACARARPSVVWTEGLIARAICRQILERRCLVLVENCQWTGHECDVLGLTTKRQIIDIEVKISRADFKADAKKDKWWHYPDYIEALDAGLTTPGKWDPYAIRIPVSHPPRVWKHYYAMPASIWKPELLQSMPSQSSGVILLREQDSVETPVVACLERGAVPSKNACLLTPEQVLDVARLANLRMWQAYQDRDTAIEKLRERDRESIQ